MNQVERQKFLDYMITNHKSEVLEALLAQPHIWPDGVSTNTPYVRREDMGFRELQVYIQKCGDVIVTILPSEDDISRFGHIEILSAEFCTSGSGGGRSPRTRSALMWLIRAMQKDEEEKPDPYKAQR